jgi:hypothetical protein
MTVRTSNTSLDFSVQKLWYSNENIIFVPLQNSLKVQEFKGD